MADPISITGLALAIPPLVEALMRFYADTKDAKADLQRHAADLFSLKGILEYIESVRAAQADNALYKYDASDFAQLLAAARDILRELQESLQPQRHSFVALPSSSICWLTPAQAKRDLLTSLLAPVNPAPTHSVAHGTHQRDTGACSPMATGKIAHTIEHMKMECYNLSPTAYAYFYCSFGTLASQSPVNILGSLLVQLSRNNERLYDDLRHRFLNLARRRIPVNLKLEELKEIFIKHAGRLGRVFIFIDAVNESESFEDVKQMLFSLARACSGMRLIVTSTDFVDLRGKESGFHIIESTMRPEAVDEDICVFIDDRTATSWTLKVLSPTLQDEIRQAIVAHSNGVFRYAESQISSVERQLTGRGVKKALSSMPQNLNEAYERILRHIHADAAAQAYVRRALLWLCFATRPLHLTELCEAVVIEDDDTDLDGDSRLRDMGVLVTLGRGLFDYDQATGLVTLGHSSIKSYLSSASIHGDMAHFRVDEFQAHNTIMRTCLTYLQFKPFAIGCGTPALSITLSANYPLLSYASQNWPLHARNANYSEWPHISAFLATKRLRRSGNYGFWIQRVAGDIGEHIIYSTDPLYYAASFGYTALVSLILTYSRPADLEQPGGRYGSTALQVACFRRQRDAAQLLILAGANPFSTDGSGLSGGFSSLFWAKGNGWEGLVTLMIERGTAAGWKLKEGSNGIYAEQLARQVQESEMKQMETASTGTPNSLWDRGEERPHSESKVTGPSHPTVPEA
ncbi:hypothetical protein K458DRAFT_376199 [Lentithecium fluviatile CBS 122367]|uniref:Nephrocystin 3-like N-terminal domain-containing protein n=1 Tax=Lentithecium fluviatile CBS 122367 TaxID=1168545 RepID=A0A6G1IKV5_9PLEO|nr:hypothetical protein K458DRAFT_376199 [Lentithecium fluviatile CBS 122367]